MGHNQLSTLAVSAKWTEVVELLAADASTEDVAAATAAAAERQLREAPRDPVYAEAVRLLLRIPAAALQPGFGRALRDLGLPVGDAPELTDILFAAGDRLDRVAREKRGGDFGELARRSLIAALSSRIGAELPGLFEATPADVETATRRFASPRDFAGLARSFYTRLVSETLSSFLDRTLATQVGPTSRFAHAGDRSAFDDALAQHCFETTRIIHEFSSGWHAKHLIHGDGGSPRAVAEFGYVALKKILTELIRRRDLG
ncbi:MAG: hypothetical protein WD969_09920 [Paracoccaceae bacterium]